MASAYGFSNAFVACQLRPPGSSRIPGIDRGPGNRQKPTVPYVDEIAGEVVKFSHNAGDRTGGLGTYARNSRTYSFHQDEFQSRSHRGHDFLTKAEEKNTVCRPRETGFSRKQGGFVRLSQESHVNRGGRAGTCKHIPPMVYAGQRCSADFQAAVGWNIPYRVGRHQNFTKQANLGLWECARAARGVQGGAESSTFLESWKKTAGKRIAYAKVTSFEDYLDTVIIIGLPIIGHKDHMFEIPFQVGYINRISGRLMYSTVECGQCSTVTDYAYAPPIPNSNPGLLGPDGFLAFDCRSLVNPLSRKNYHLTRSRSMIFHQLSAKSGEGDQRTPATSDEKKIVHPEALSEFEVILNRSFPDNTRLHRSQSAKEKFRVFFPKDAISLFFSGERPHAPSNVLRHPGPTRCFKKFILNPRHFFDATLPHSMRLCHSCLAQKKTPNGPI
ncbi:unnamed protein product, partial [Nesidiocoris tenuis]